MSEKIGPMTVGKKEEQIFLGKELGQHKNYSEQIAVLIDQEIKHFIQKNYDRAKKILMEKTNILHNLANALLEHETLDGNEVQMIASGKVIPKKFKTNKSKTEGQQAANPPADHSEDKLKPEDKA